MGDETINETNDEDKEETSECETSLSISTDDTTVATCEHSEQLLIHGGADLTAESAPTSGEMCLPVKALVKRSKKSTNDDQTARYPSITGTLSERCVQSVEHIIQVFYLLCSF